MYQGLSGNLPVSLSFTNLTSGNNQTLKIGDKWAIEVHGNSGWAVTVTGSKNGQPFTFPPMGTIDANGIFRLEGSVLPDQVGTWVETWLVGGVQAGVLIFTVVPAPAPQTAPPPPQTSNYVPTEQPPAMSMSLPNIPTWLLLAGGVGALLLIGGRR